MSLQHSKGIKKMYNLDDTTYHEKPDDIIFLAANLKIT
jgi:hypothetical protein